MKAKPYSHIGQRTNQEDALGIEENTLYIICDGVGGHTKGEVASNFIANKVSKSTASLPKLNEKKIQQLLEDSQKDLIKILDQSPDSEGMGTTFAGVFITNKAVYVTHIGDSRIYYLKPKTQQFWHTWDHSLVGYLVQTGEITREAGRFHPQNNRISRAIIAQKPLKIAKADITTLTHIEEGDLFFICTDGVNESWSDLDLVKLLVSNNSIEDKLNIIKEKCDKESRDNNTAIIVEIEPQDIIQGKVNTIKMLSIEDLEEDYDNYLKEKEISG